MLQVLTRLEKLPDFQLVQDIRTARVPLLKLQFKDATESVDVDFSCDNRTAMLNTQLLQAYVRIHPAVQNLALFVKLWAKAHGVLGAPQGNLSSFSLTLMVIYFMQVQCSLPRLAQEELRQTGDCEVPHWPCALAMSELVHQFFYFFSTVFLWGTEVVSVRLGRRADASVREFKMLPGRTRMRLHIEDPYLADRNLNCVLGEAQESELLKKMGEGLRASARSQLPETVQKYLEGLHGQQSENVERCTPFDAAASIKEAARSLVAGLPPPPLMPAVLPETPSYVSSLDSEAVLHARGQGFLNTAISPVMHASTLSIPAIQLQ